MTDKRTEERIPVLEEELRLDKRRVETGRVRVRMVTDQVEEVVRGQLDEDVVDIERVPVDRVLDTVPEIRTEGEVMIIPVVEEVLVVEKRLVLKEELHVRRRRTSELVEMPVTVRKQRAVVERLPGDDLDTDETS